MGERPLGALGKSLLALGVVLAIGLVAITGVAAARLRPYRSGQLKTQFFLAPDIIPAGLPEPPDPGWVWNPVARPPSPEVVPFLEEVMRRLGGPWTAPQGKMTIQVDVRKRGFIARGTEEYLDALQEVLDEMSESRRLTR